MIQTDEEVATALEAIASLLAKYAKCLRGEAIDDTGMGMLRMAFIGLERVLGVKVLNKDQWAWFEEEKKKLERKE